MKSKKFIQKRLKELFDKFNNIKIQYEYNANTATHIIEINPINFFKNENYIILEAELEEKFENLFPDQSIIFISENSLSKIKNAEFKLGY
jgi:hypothetical protein